MAKVIENYAKMTDEIACKKAVIFAQDEKEYGRAIGYLTKESIYLYYKDVKEKKFLTIYLDLAEIRDKFNYFKTHDDDLIEMFDCPSFVPRKIYINKDSFIFKNRKNAEEEYYRLELGKIKKDI